MRRFQIGVLLAACLAVSAQADLAGLVDEIMAPSLQQDVHFSIHIVEAKTGRTVYRHDERELMIPASNMKLITTAAALHNLGPEFEYRTKVGLCSETLVVIGSGDPLLGDEKNEEKHGRRRSRLFEEIRDALKNKGRKTLEDIIIDTTVFDDERVHPAWPKKQLNQWYACEVSGLNFNDNCIDVTVRNNGGSIDIDILPRTRFVQAVNKIVATSDNDSAVGTYRTPEANRIIFRGKCKSEVGPFSVAIERPAAFFGFVLAEYLAAAGIPAKGRLFEKPFTDETRFEPLVEFTTPIADCLARCHKDSLGLVAESLMKTVAAHSKPDRKGGSWARAQEVVSWYLLGLGLDSSQFYIDDGSGLSRQNELTAYTITTVLLDIYNGDNWELYRDSLAIGGRDGTIAKYFKKDKHKGRILGKTGYIRAVKTFSGVCLTDKGPYIFSILANNTNGDTRTVINEIAEAVMDCYAEPEKEPVSAESKPPVRSDTPSPPNLPGSPRQ